MNMEWSELGRSGRAVYVQQPGRRFPSLCVQGDTAYLWLREVAETLSNSAAPDNAQLRLLGSELYAVVEGYVEVCREASGRVPFEWPDPVIENSGLDPVNPEAQDT